MGINVELATQEEVLNIWKQSPHASIFTHPHVLQSLSDKVVWWVAKKGEEPQCLWPICYPYGQDVGIPEFTYYAGPIWAKETYEMPAHRWLSRSKQVYNAMVETILINHQKIASCLPIGLDDVRVFDWWNYHSIDQPRFHIAPRYTARIKGLQSQTIQEITQNFRELRKRELKKIDRAGIPKGPEEYSEQDVIALYQEVLGQQGIDVSPQTIRSISNLVQLAKKGFGETLLYRDTDNHPVAAILLLDDMHASHMVLNLVTQSWKEKGIGAWIVYQALMRAKEKGIDQFDFNGANSPNRGDDKHSYGAEPVLYFQIRYPSTPETTVRIHHT